jgi:16S rRNA (guanine527-N7)-methyltransferase
MEIGVKKHLLDSLSIVPFIDKSPLLDVGSGAGLPGIGNVCVVSTHRFTHKFYIFFSLQMKCQILTFINSLKITYIPMILLLTV